MPNRPSFSLYLHISIMDLLNGVSGVILAGFLLQNLSDPIDPNAAGEFCKWFAPAPKCIIRVVLFLMTLLSALRVSIVANQGLSQWTNLRINICIIFAYLCGVVYIFSFIATSYKSMALPDGWCVYLTHHNLTTKDKFFTILLDASPVVIYSLFIIGCHAYVKLRFLWGSRDTEYLIPSRQNSMHYFQAIQSFMSQIIVWFILSYSLAIYIEMRQILKEFGLPYDYIMFIDGDGTPPTFNINHLTLFRLVYVFVITYSIINPILILHSSTLIRESVLVVISRIRNGPFCKCNVQIGYQYVA